MKCLHRFNSHAVKCSGLVSHKVTTWYVHMRYALDMEGCGLTIPEQCNNVVYTEEEGMYNVIIMCRFRYLILVIWFLVVRY